MKIKWGKKLFILLIICTSIVLICGNNSNNVTLDEVRLKDVKEKDNGMFAIYVETKQEDGSYKYVESNANAWPNDARYNTEKSGCVDSNNQVIVDALTYNNDTNKISLKTKGAIYCYLYFDLGTESRPYEIQYIEDLVDLSKNVRSEKSYEGVYFELTKDLDFNQEESYRDYTTMEYGDINGVNGVEDLKTELTNTSGTGFIPIGDTSHHFKGNFDGKDKKIENIYIYNQKDKYIRMGLFGYVENSEISNLTVSGNIKTDVVATIGMIGAAQNSQLNKLHNQANITSRNSETYNSGGIVGSIFGNVTISNCENSGTVDGGYRVAGIASYVADNAKLTIESSSNNGEIKNNNGVVMGGIVGGALKNSEIIINNSSNNGNLVANNSENISHVGGILAYSEGKKINIKNCFNTGVINATAKEANQLNVAGIFGYLTGSSELSVVENCYNKGNITGGIRVGGIGGVFLNTNAKLVINKCYNDANITSQADSIRNQNVYAGGLLCSVYTNTQSSPIVYILNSYNAGIITVNVSNVTKGFAAGFMYSSGNDGDNSGSKGIILNSYNKGDLVAKTGAEGISKAYTTSSLIVDNVYNVGTFSSPDNKIIYNSTTGEVKVSNVYYKEQDGVQASNKEMAGIQSMTDENMKKQDFVNQLNENKNSIKLEEIDAVLKDYKLEEWVLDPKTGYPTLQMDN